MHSLGMRKIPGSNPGSSLRLELDTATMEDVSSNVKIDPSHGYAYMYDPSHPMANRSGKVYIHRLVASQKVGRKLASIEHVHHIDGNKLNNSPSNLLVTTSSQHAIIHHIENGHRMSIFSPCLICGKKTTNKKYCSQACSSFSQRRVERPSKEQLSKDIKSMSWLAIGRKYGVTDNAVRSWARHYEIID